MNNIIVRMPNWLGDLVMATPILADLRHAFPKASITAMCQKNGAPLLLHDPHINELFAFKRPNGWVHRQGHYEIIEPLRKGEYDLGLLLTNSFSSAWWFWRGHVKNRIGFTDTLRNLLLTKSVPYPENKETQHLVNTYKALLGPLNIPISDTPPRLYLQSQEIEEASNLLKRQGANKTIVGINPGAAYGSAKCWLPERFVEVSKRLLEDPEISVVFFGDQAGKPLVDEICNQLPKRTINLAGKTSIRELLGLIKVCDALLTNDSGPMHIAAALGTPLVALFGSTSDTKTGPYKSGTVIHKHVECSPCYKRTCPIDFRCMKRISSEEVYLALRGLLHGKKASI